MRPIPQSLRDEMSNDPYYKKCCIADNDCSGRIEWHHALIFGGRQQNYKFCILPLCHAHHLQADKKEVKERLNIIMVNRSTKEELAPFCKAINYEKYRTNT